VGSVASSGALRPEQVEVLIEILFEARSWGFLGPGPVEPHIAHALGFAAAFDAAPSRLADLGSGGGVPGLVLAELWPEAEVVLIDAHERRTEFLRRVVPQLERSTPLTVVRERAEVLGRDSTHRGSFDAVVARGFGPPAATAECAAPLLRVQGRLVVSEPPEDIGRWDAERLALLGLWLRPAVEGPAGRFQGLDQVSPCPSKYPRSVGKPAKRPLF
jgi:16S rRNA (guanine527-N7)-methyltransferase